MSKLKNYDLYGFKLSDLDFAKEIVESALRIKLVPHESSFHGGEYYRLGNIGEEHYILQYNHDEFEQEWTEELFQNYGILLYINESKDPNSTKKKLLKESDLIFLLRQNKA